MRQYTSHHLALFNVFIDSAIGIGEVWANMLHNVYAALVNAREFSNDKLTNPHGQEGNVVFMRLFLDALPLQPCNLTCKY